MDDENLDADNLFAYLLLEKHVPLTVFFTAELTFQSNVVVLNSSVVQRLDAEKELARLQVCCCVFGLRMCMSYGLWFDSCPS